MMIGVPVRLLSLIFIALTSSFFASTAFAAIPCHLTSDDYKSLAASPAKLTKQEADSASDEIQASICTTREFYHTVVRENGNISRTEHYSPDFLTKKEFDIVSGAVNAFIERVLLPLLPK